jgi:hypothetical protein
MAKGTTTTQDNTSSSSTRPWDAAQPLLNNIIGGLSNVSGTPTTAQTSAGNNLVNAAGGIPDLSGSEIGAVNGLFSSNTQPQQDMLSGGYGDLKKNLGGYLDPSYLNPMNTPGFSDALRTMNSDIGNQVNGSFAAAGRDLSPANSTYLARGLSQGEGGLLANQFNQNVAAQQGAAGTLFNAAGSTANNLANSIQGLSAAGGLGGLLTSPAQAQLGAANTQAGIPLGMLAQLESLGIPLAALGSQTTGTGHGTQTVEQPLGPSIAGGLLGGATLASKFGLLSDERAKENIERVGELDDGQPVYRYEYRADPAKVTHIGLLAQEVEQLAPDAVHEIGGLKRVDYRKATERATHAGGLLSDMMAA